MPDERDRGRRPGADERRWREGPQARGAEQSGRRDRTGRGGAERKGGRTERVARAPQPKRDEGKVEREERPADPAVDSDVTGHELDEEVRAALGSLPSGTAATVSRHMVMAGRLLGEDPEQAYQHALAARRRAARLGVVREAAGVTAYGAGHYAEALAELRAARRMTGASEYLPMMADCERGLGRPERALDLAGDPAVSALPTDMRVEMLIVAAGARRDLGELDGAVSSLQVPELRSRARQPWVARLQYAYADALEAAGRTEEARRWFRRAAEADVEDDTDASERVELLDEALGRQPD